MRGSDYREAAQVRFKAIDFHRLCLKKKPGLCRNTLPKKHFASMSVWYQSSSPPPQQQQTLFFHFFFSKNYGKAVDTQAHKLRLTARMPSISLYDEILSALNMHLRDAAQIMASRGKMKSQIDRFRMAKWEIGCNTQWHKDPWPVFFCLLWFVPFD